MSKCYWNNIRSYKYECCRRCFFFYQVAFRNLTFWFVLKVTASYLSGSFKKILSDILLKQKFLQLFRTVLIWAFCLEPTCWHRARSRWRCLAIDLPSWTILFIVRLSFYFRTVYYFTSSSITIKFHFILTSKNVKNNIVEKTRLHIFIKFRYRDDNY